MGLLAEPTLLAGLGLAGALLFANLGRAWLLLFPGRVEVEAEAPGEQMEVPREWGPLTEQLGALGFAPLGSYEERAWLRPRLRGYAYAHASLPVFATLYPSPEGPPRVELLTPLVPEGFVITASWRRPALELEGRYRAGGLEGASPERLLRVHQRRLAGLTPGGAFTWEGRVAASQAWYRGLGRREVRQQNLSGLMWVVTALVILACALLGPVRPD